MTDHRATLITFLRTDLYRIEAALEDADWSDTIATRLTEHCQRLAAVLGLTTGDFPTTSPLTGMDNAIDTFHELTETLLDAIRTIPATRLEASVLDPHDRNLTVLAHLYDYARLSAMLVEWTTALPHTSTLDKWFDALDDTP